TSRRPTWPTCWRSWRRSSETVRSRSAGGSPAPRSVRANRLHYDDRGAPMIWDVHTHLSGVDGRTPEERMARLLAFADRMGVERVCVFMGFPFLTDPTPDQLREQN